MSNENYNEIIVWENKNKIKDELSDKEFLKRVEEYAKIIKRLEKNTGKHFGRDGKTMVYEKKFIYRGFPFWVRVLRYHIIGVPISEMKGMNHLGKWAVLEYDKSTKKIVDTINNSDLFKRANYFLYEDTLNSSYNKATLQQMFESMVRLGKQDIDWLLDKSQQHFNKKIKNIKKNVFDELKKQGLV